MNRRTSRWACDSYKPWHGKETHSRYLNHGASR
jgi:hypothetical protein